MANPATRWEDQVDAGPAWTLRVAGEDERRVAEFRAKVREAGERWRHTRTTGLTELLCAAAADDPELVWLARAGGQLLEDFLEGFGRNAEKTSLDHASDLIDGEQLPHEVLNRLAEAYVVVVTRSMVEGRAAGDRPDLARRGVLCTRRAGVSVLLVPDGDTVLLDRITAELVGAGGWVATARGAVTGLAEAYAEASDVLRLVVAGRRPGGVYGLPDVLLEHAIIGNDSVAARLAEVIRPLRDEPMLWETLVALVRVDFNRNQASNDLFVHRSTMDYRMRRIAKVTGYDPGAGRGSQVLSAALIADAMA